jgi:hypothetical protein
MSGYVESGVGRGLLSKKIKENSGKKIVKSQAVTFIYIFT